MADPKLLFGLAFAAIAGGLAIAAAKEGAVESGMKEARDSLFEVAPDCSSISFKGGGNAPDPAKLEQAKAYYFLPYVKKHMVTAELEAGIHGVTEAEFLAAGVLYQLFPECNVDGVRPWPPENILTSGTFGVIWVFMKLYIGQLLAEAQAG